MHKHTIPAVFLTVLSLARPASAVAAQTSAQTPSSADVDGDGRPELLLLDAEGSLRLVRGPDGGRFEDLTSSAGLGALEGASCAALLDLDSDGDLDLFVGSALHRVWLNVGAGRFLPVSGGIEHDEFDLALDPLDVQGDGLVDLWLSTERGPRLYANLGAGQFELLDLGASTPFGSLAAAARDALAPESSEVDEGELAPADAATRARRRIERWRGRWAAGASASTPSGAGSAGGPFAAASTPTYGSCTRLLYDFGAGLCIRANSVPTLGELYPLSTDFNVSAAGNVGIGTTAPAAKLDVVGGIRASGALTAGGALDTLGLRVTPLAIAPTPQSTIETVNVVVGVVNSVSPFAVGATVSGGGYRETITGTPFGTIVNERQNRANDDYCTVAGGMYNLAGRLNPAGSLPEARHATVCGGRFNAAVGADSTIGGGYSNEAEGQFSAVLGGEQNTASGYASATLGGADNQAFGGWSVAAGRRAGAGDGCFVFADSTNADFNSSAANQFLIRASGGVGIGTNTPGAPLDVAGSIRASGPLVSTQGTGVAPLDVLSTTKVANLNADLLDGVDSSVFSQLGASIESNEITNGTLVDADVAPGAAIAGSKINPNFGSQALVCGDVSMSGTLRVGAPSAEGPLHVAEGSAGAVSANTSSAAVLERNANCFLQLLSPDANETGVLFGNPTDGAAAGAIVYNSTVADGFAFRVAGNSTKMVIASSGNVGIGTSAPSFLLHVDGSAGKPGGGSWSVASDARLKTNVAELDGALAKLLELRGVTYEYKDPAAIHELEGEQAGFLAQEVERVFPEWVESGADGYKRLSIRGFEALTVEALRELRNEAAERAERDAARIASLEAQMEELKALVRASLASGASR